MTSREAGRAAAPSAVREALRRELVGRGYAVANDTVSLRNELYVAGHGDRVAAIFEFKTTAAEAAETMYQGRWTPDLPPRFAVLREPERKQPGADLLEQAGFSLLFFEERGQDILFVDLEAALDEIARRSRKEAGGD